MSSPHLGKKLILLLEFCHSMSFEFLNTNLPLFSWTRDMQFFFFFFPTVLASGVKISNMRYSPSQKAGSFGSAPTDELALLAP